MRRFVLFLATLSGMLMAVTILCPPCLQAAPQSRQAARMRPYAGIGVLMLATASDEGGMPPAPLPLYNDPAIYRLGELEKATIPRHEWIFGPDGGKLPLIVMARKGEWLRVVYDDAGREAWINPSGRAAYHPWDAFLKDRSGRLLPGLQKKHYQLFHEPEGGPLVTLSPLQPFTVTMLDGDWIHLVVTDQNLAGWLRWRDGDGRLLVGLGAGDGLTGQ